MPDQRTVKPYKNCFQFMLYRGGLLWALSSLLGPISIACLVVNAIFVWMSFDEYSHEPAMSWAERGTLIGMAIAFRLLVVLTRRLIFRWLDITLQDDGFEMTYLPFLFLRKSIRRLYYADIAGCEIVERKLGRIHLEYIVIQMKDGKRLRLWDQMRWFRKSDRDSTINFGIDRIAETYERYRQTALS